MLLRLRSSNLGHSTPAVLALCLEQALFSIGVSKSRQRSGQPITSCASPSPEGPESSSDQPTAAHSPPGGLTCELEVASGHRIAKPITDRMSFADGTRTSGTTRHDSGPFWGHLGQCGGTIHPDSEAGGRPRIVVLGLKVSMDRNLQTPARRAHRRRIGP